MLPGIRRGGESMLDPLNICEFNLIGLNIGCGKNFERVYEDKRFLYVDIDPYDGEIIIDQPNAQLVKTSSGFHYLQCDLTVGLPIAPDCAHAVLLEHVIEHLDLAAAMTLLRGVYRVLAPGGCLRVSIPDLALYVSAYQRGDRAFFEAHGRAVAEPVVDCWDEFVGPYLQGAAPFMPAALERDEVASFLSRPAVSINQIFRFWGHRWIYDFAELSLLLSTAGFGKNAITKQVFGFGHDCRLARMDRSFRKDETLYVEAVK